MNLYWICIFYLNYDYWISNCKNQSSQSNFKSDLIWIKLDYLEVSKAADYE